MAWIICAAWYLIVLAIQELFGEAPETSGRMEIGPLVHRTEGQCGVCRSTLGSAPVECPKCRSLHHRTCWLYARACPVYGCGGRPGSGDDGQAAGDAAA
jgi:hypothetical protein